DGECFLSRDGKLSLGWDRRLREVDTGKVLHVLRAGDERLLWAAFSPDGKLVAIVGDNGHPTLWDVKTGKPVRALVSKGVAQRLKCVAFSPDGKLLLAGGSGGRLQLWDLQTGKATSLVEDLDQGDW